MKQKRSLDDMIENGLSEKEAFDMLDEAIKQGNYVQGKDAIRRIINGDDSVFEEQRLQRLKDKENAK